MVMLQTDDDVAVEWVDLPKANDEGSSVIIPKASLPCDTVLHHVARRGRQWYYLVFVPYDKNYNEYYNAFDFIRRGYCRGSPGFQYVATKEKATKVHWNLLICTDYDMMSFHLKATRRFKVFAQTVTLGEHPLVYNYITKDYYRVYENNWVLYDHYIYK